ncbi:tetratricopeptide repeat protein [Piscinibacter gummiphilus]|uniref:Uncharacterized protein n=1 Tax=Piscinibacter gummiphilus TaxID=946333 RepID=A0A1W6L4V8_9BURK|nr:tetratricopeptide repeat protein [Piscinibacter gummiphilus]ARN19345.1 hypothetical protein A4W93_05150 [Piscinibacter gummiphilus]ATU64012.1 hypothetical protein CPZ87_05235 [Piscinibacter gummiphilus]GLS93028.1 hypothetical protein GCM10007918_03190 [Piscinibacter gummiphilus]
MSPTSPATPGRLERLGNFLQHDPDNATLLRDYAVEASRTGEHHAAAAALARLAERGQATLDDHLAWAQALRRDGRNDEALQVLGGAERRWPGDPWVAYETASCHFADRAFDRAFDALRDPSPQDPAGAEVDALRIRLLHHLGRMDEAAAIADRFQASPHPAISRAAVPVWMDLGRFDEALGHARALAGTVPEGETPPYEACEALASQALDQGDPAGAQPWLRAALSVRRDDGRVWVLAGLTSLAIDDTASAIDAFERAVALMPGHAGSHLALGWAFLATQRLPEAGAAFAAGADADPSFAETHGSLAVLAAMQGRTAEARELIRKAQRLDRQSASALWAAHLLDGGDVSQVSRLAARVIGRARTQRQSTSPDSSSGRNPS